MKWQQFFRKALKQESCGQEQTQHSSVSSVQSGKQAIKHFGQRLQLPFEELQNHSECMDIAKDLDLL
jgi:hypothetical protein